MNIIIGSIILVLAIINDKSFIGKVFRKKNVDLLENFGTDKVVEFYKTLSYVFLGLFWILMKYIQFIVPCIILCNLLAYIHYIRNPELIRKASLEEKTFPTLNRMFLICGTNLGVLIIIETFIMSRKSWIIVVCLGTVLLFCYIVRGLQMKAKLLDLALFIVPVIFFVMGSVLAINSFYGARIVDRVETVVSDIHIGMRANSFMIPEEDAIDGKTSFPEGNVINKVGAKVKIVELEGCLGIRWFETKWVTD